MAIEKTYRTKTQFSLSSLRYRSIHQGNFYIQSSDFWSVSVSVSHYLVCLQSVL